MVNRFFDIVADWFSKVNLGGEFNNSRDRYIVLVGICIPSGARLQYTFEYGIVL